MNFKRYIKNKDRLIYENTFRGKTIVNVDIQPEYEDYISFDLNEWAEFINENGNDNSIVFLYNGWDTLGMITEEKYKEWLYDLGIDEYIINRADFYDKGYAFFRYCIDSSIDEYNIVDLVKYMIRNDINDSREIDSEIWDDYMNESGKGRDEIRELLEYADDMINIPDLMDYIKSYNNIVLTGGALEQCLKEVEIAIMVLEKKYEIMHRFTY